MQIDIRNYYYTIISSSNTCSWVSTLLYPVFEVVFDMDLAEKFCPTLKLFHPTEWVAPEPVEYIGVAKQDLWFLLYNNNGQQVDDYPITDESQFSPPIHNWHQWMNSSDPNYSFLTGDGYEYNGQPPGKTYGTYYLRFHYNYAGDADEPSEWIAHYQTERNQNNYPHTTYAHVFKHNNKPVIQYWFYYPYNDGYNNHEGDWEHINVRLSSFSPTNANIEIIDYYFHHKVMTKSSNFELEDGTHPVIWVGGTCGGMSWPYSCEPGNQTGGCYPGCGMYFDAGPNGYIEAINCNPGLIIAHENLSITVIPNPSEVDYNSNPELCWLKVNIRFGNLEVNSPWDFIEPFMNIPVLRELWTERDIGNDAVPGPTHNAGWEEVGAAGHFENYYQ